jgi:hypothetical protein
VTTPVLAECPPATIRPSYLPWLEPGETVPKPKEETEGKNAVLIWSAGAQQGWKHGYVALVAEHEPVFGRGKDLAKQGFESINIRGSTAYLIWVGDPGVGELALTWSEGTQPCDTYSIYVWAENLDPGVAKEEIKRVGESVS